MPTRRSLRTLCLAALTALAPLSASAAPPAGPATTVYRFQGELSRNGQPLSGPCDFRFSLWSAPVGGAQIGPTINVNNLNIIGGWVSRGLDFSPPGNAVAFDGTERFLQIAFRSPAGSGPFTTLSRQEIKPVPYAVRALGPWVSSDSVLSYTGGAVGIGSTDPDTFTLDVNGEIRCVDVTVTAPSDSRLKKDIHPIAPGSSLQSLLALHGVTFEYTDDAVKSHHLHSGPRTGFIAQDVEQVFPRWVGFDKDGYRYISEQGTTALMVEALRDLRAEKDKQLAEKDKQLANLASANDDLRKRLAALEAAVAQLADAGKASTPTVKPAAEPAPDRK